MVDIDNMSTSEWLNYRDNLLEDFYNKGFKLIPNIECKQCDVYNNYTCFECECIQLNENGF